MQRLEVSGAVRPIYGKLGVKRLTRKICYHISFSILNEGAVVSVLHQQIRFSAMLLLTRVGKIKPRKNVLASSPGVNIQ